MNSSVGCNCYLERVHYLKINESVVQHEQVNMGFLLYKSAWKLLLFISKSSLGIIFFNMEFTEKNIKESSNFGILLLFGSLFQKLLVIEIHWHTNAKSHHNQIQWIFLFFWGVFWNIWHFGKSILYATIVW